MVYICQDFLRQARSACPPCENSTPVARCFKSLLPVGNRTFKDLKHHVLNLQWCIYMTEVSYYILNKSYVINTIIFVVAFLIFIAWMHIKLHISMTKDSQTACRDPIALFYDRKLAERCYVNDVTQSISWVDKNLDKVIETMNAQQTEANARITGLYTLYKNRNDQRAASFAKRIEDKKFAFDELQNTVDTIKTGIQENERGTAKLLNDYKEVIRENIFKMRELAAGIVEKLRRNMYTPEYQDKREIYTDAYEEIDTYLNQINKDRFFENEIKGLDEIPGDLRKGLV